MAKTRAELKVEALGILVGLDPQQEPEIEDLATVEIYVDPLLAQLSKDEIVYIDDSEAIPDEYFLPLSRLLANVAGPRFGSAINEAARQSDEQALRRLTSSKPTLEVLKAQYF